MLKNTIKKSSFLLRGTFIVSLVLLIFITLVSFFHIVKVKNSSKSVMRSFDTQIKLQMLLTCLKDIQNTLIDYLLTYDSIYININQYDILKLNQIHSDLVKLYLKDTLPLIKLNQLKKQIDADLLSIKIDPKNKVDHSFFINLLRTRNEKLNQVSLQIYDMINLQVIKIKQTQDKLQTEVYLDPFFIFFIFLISLFSNIFAFIKMNGNLNRLKIANKQLIIDTESFKHAEEIGKFYHWEWNIDQDTSKFSENLYNLLDFSPLDDVITNEIYIQFVHPEDRNLILEATKKAKITHLYFLPLYRIILKNNELRYFMSVGKTITDKEGNSVMIGVTKDITTEHLNNQVLNRQNRNLIRSNKELESFNHIASHDLQEPLRKIQLFISKISEQDLNSISLNGRETINKIQISTDRMRKLIDDLLQFSQFNKSDHLFNNIDLNKIVMAIKRDLDIDDNTLTIDFLPTLKGIPFQMHQLFLNLITNAIKYKTPNIPIRISLKSELVSEGSFLKDSNDFHKMYYHISVSDNGIGFQQEYAESLFILFWRLHQSTEFSGTGIGLAIAKKIVDNHNGFIFAVGNPNEGAAFNIYLPA